LLWQPINEFNAQLAYNRVESDGFGPNADSPLFNGGADPFDPAIVYPDTDKYEVVRRYREPFERTSEMWSLDLSYDVGFATVSSTSTLFKTDGELFSESTLGTASLPAVFVSYYTGTPTNPRFNSVGRFTDRNRSFTQEVRLVSNGSGSIDYVIGAFYQRERRTDLWSAFGFGQFDYNQLPGVISNSGIGPDDRYFTVGGKQVFTDRSVFGEVTWHATSRLDIAGGFRLFKQKLERDVESNIPNFFLFEQAQNTAEFSDAVFKLNVSYEFADRNRLYAVFSQGFRRGGANAFAISGFAQEPTSILSYEPDLVDNYEIGLKGRVLNGWLYTVDLFYNRWSNPQIGTFTPYNLWPVTVNGKRARSAGFEFEARGPLAPDFYLSLGYAYTDAKLTADFCVPAGVGDGVNFDPCAIPGVSGTTLPSAPKHSGTATLDYSHEFGGGNKLTVSANVNYKGSMRQNLPAINSRYVMLPSYVLTNLNIAFETGPWTISGYARNLFDVRPVYSAYSRITPFVPLDRVDTIGRPRELGIGLKYSW
jgi:outer membrane receptor protein involved in Fe transport